MAFNPSVRRLGWAAAIGIVAAVLAYFLPMPHPDPAVLVWPFAGGFVSSYLAWPWIESAQHPRGFWRPTPARVLKALGVAVVGATTLAWLQILRGDGRNVVGWLVAFAFIAFLIYANLGGTPHWRLGQRQER